jgi:colicin import membrane protein
VIAQSAAAVIIGVLIFFGFTLLWDNLGTVLVLVMALVVTCVCVGVVHTLLRHRDTLLLVLTFVVGIALTVGPRLIMSI